MLHENAARNKKVWALWNNCKALKLKHWDFCLVVLFFFGVFLNRDVNESESAVKCK